MERRNCILTQDLGYVLLHSSLAEKPPLKEFDPLALLGVTFYTENQSVDSAQLISAKGVAYAVNQYPPDQGGNPRSGIHWKYAGLLSHREYRGDQAAKRAAPGAHTRLGPLVPGGECED
jgi:hypothetical protein